MAVCCAALAGCQSPSSPSDIAPVDTASSQHIIYLHGRIIEDEGVTAVSPRFGPYRFADIVARLEAEGYTVHAPVRGPNADPAEHADRIAAHIRQLLESGISAQDITVLGASKGAFIASLVSHHVRNPRLDYVLLAGCAPGVVDYMVVEGITLHGRVLAIREETDTLAGSCQEAVDRSPDIAEFREELTQTGLEHGLIFSPDEAWVQPLLEWTQNHNAAR